MRTVITTIAACVFLLAAVNAAAQQKEAAFKGGEHLAFAVNYRVGIVNTDVAVVSFDTKEEKLDGKDIFAIKGIGRTEALYKWFFDLNDVYVSRLDAATLRPVDLTVELSEGKYRASSYQKYDWNNMVVSSSYRNHNRDETPSVKTMKLLPGAGDAMALYFNLRSLDRTKLVKDQPVYLDMILDDTIRRMSYTFLGRENKNIKGTGKFKTLKFRGQIVTSNDESFKDGSEFTIWISDDRNMIPLYVETPIRVGSVRVRLTEYSNLKYPFESKR